jgi:hypothetical protein
VDHGLSRVETDALAAAFPDGNSARRLLETAGLRVDQQPSWAGLDAVGFWWSIAQLITHGKLVNGRQRLLEAALAEFPGNRVFAAAVRATPIPTPMHPDSGEGPITPAAPGQRSRNAAASGDAPGPMVSGALVGSLLARHARHRAGLAVDAPITASLDEIWDLADRRLRVDRQASGALERLVQAPDNVNRQAAVTDHLDEILTADPEFRRQLADVLRATAAEPGAAWIHETGAVSVGGSVFISGTYAAGRDVAVNAADHVEGRS